MLKGYCISCGNELGEYVLSLAGLFVDADETSLDYMRRAFLRGDIVFAEDKLRNSKVMKPFFDGNAEEGYEFIRNARRDVPRLIMNNDLGFYLDYDEDEELLAEEIDETEAIIKNEHCQKFFWVREMVAKLHAIASNVGGNRILQALLSVNGENVGAGFYHIDLKKKITVANVQNLIDRITPAIDGGISNMQLIKEVNDIEEFMNDYMDCVEKCSFRFEPNDPPHYQTKLIDGHAEYVTELMINQKSVFRRICPNCGAHIPSKMCIYPQKIISFVGSACSGKSTFINSVFSRLNNIGPQHIPGIMCDFEYKDPNYKVYSNAFDNAVNNFIAVEKTEVGTYPTLTVTLRSGENGDPILYTFVDVPGELFSYRDEDHDTHFSRIRIMRHSDIICLTIAAEQLMGRTDDGTGMTKAVSTEAMGQLRDILANFQIQLGNDFKGQLHMVVTKVDELMPKQRDFTADSEERWICSGLVTDIKKTDIDSLFSDLASMPDIRSIKENTNSDIIVQAKDLISLQYKSHKFIECFIQNIPALTAIINNFGMDLGSVPIFMTAAFGFYALENIWQLSESEIRTTLGNIVKDELSDDVLKRNISIIEETIIANRSKGELRDKLDANVEKGTVADAQNILGFTADDIKEILMERYRDDHRNTATYGINAFIMWLFIETGLVRYLYKLPSSTENISKYAGRIIWADLPRQRERFRQVTILRGDTKDQKFAAYADDELRERKELLENLRTAKKEMENAEEDYKDLQEALRQKYGDKIQTALEKFRNRGDKRMLEDSYGRVTAAKNNYKEQKIQLEEYDRKSGIYQLR